MGSISDIKKISFFTELSDSELQDVYSFCKFRTCKEKEIIFFETEPYIGFFAVLIGKVKIYKISPEGREHIIHFINPPNTFAEAPLFEKYWNESPGKIFYPANAMSLEDDTEVVLVPADKLVELTKGNITICYKLISSLSKRLRNLNKHIETLVLSDVYNRVCKYFYTQAGKQITSTNQNSIEFELEINKNDLASYLGTISETLSRCLKKIQDEGLIQVNGKNILIPNLQNLRSKTI